MWERDQDLVNLYDAGDPGRWVHLVLALPSALRPTERGWERLTRDPGRLVHLVLGFCFPVDPQSERGQLWEGTGGKKGGKVFVR